MITIYDLNVKREDDGVQIWCDELCCVGSGDDLLKARMDAVENLAGLIHELVSGKEMIEAQIAEVAAQQRGPG